MKPGCFLAGMKPSRHSRKAVNSKLTLKKHLSGTLKDSDHSNSVRSVSFRLNKTQIYSHGTYFTNSSLQSLVQQQHIQPLRTI